MCWRKHIVIKQILTSDVRYRQLVAVPFTIPPVNTVTNKYERVQFLRLVLSCGYHTAARTPGRTKGLQNDCQNKTVYRNLVKGSEIPLGNNNKPFYYLLPVACIVFCDECLTWRDYYCFQTVFPTHRACWFNLILLSLQPLPVLNER